MSDSLDFYIRTPQDLVNVINRVGFLPIFSNDIPGFSAEEHTDPSALWGAEDGLWEWKGPVIQQSGCAYGKLLMGKATFVNRYWFPDFANVRRDGYDFDARYDEGLAPLGDSQPVRSIGGRDEDGKPNAMTGGRAWDAGAAPMDEWTTYSVTGETLQKLAERGGKAT